MAPTAARPRRPPNRRRELTSNSLFLMWVQKSSEEIAAQNRLGRKRELRTVIGLLVIMAIVVLATPPKGNPFSLWYRLHLPLQGWLPRGVVVLLIAALLCVLSCYWFRRSKAERCCSWLCPKCETVKAPDGNPDCKCGGKFVDLNSVKWVK